MNSRERVMRTLSFQNPDRLAKDIWVLPAVPMKYGDEFHQLQRQWDTDIVSVSGPFDHANTPQIYQLGTFVDEWGSQWSNIQPGIIGEVKKPVLAELDDIDSYQAPTARFLQEWQQQSTRIDSDIAAARSRDKFVIGGWISLFERMQYLRGTENLYCDIALADTELDQLTQLVMEYTHTYLDKWLEKDVDAVAFGDDWGSQISLLIDPKVWRSRFRPLYQQLFDKIKAAGKKIFFHSDGYIFDLYEDFIQMGVDAINSQIWCMGLDKVADAFAGKITFWGEISRQDTLPYGTPEEIAHCASQMKQRLFVGGGGLIGQGEVNHDVPLTNMQALYSAWER